MRSLAVALVLVLGVVSAGSAASFGVAEGTYEALPPADWDGTTPLRLLVVFHGYRGTGAQMLQDERLTGLAAEHGYLLVAPDGRANERGAKSWSHQGSPSQNRDEFAFIDAVLADVRERLPLAPALPVITGFSQGASMVWDIACRRGGTFARYVAVSGGFWEPMPEHCMTPVGEFVHVHGLDDPVVPIEGRAIGGRWRQADIYLGLLLFKAAAGCPVTPDTLDAEGAMHCRRWTSCTVGAVTFCLHPGGHGFELGPLARVLERR